MPYDSASSRNAVRALVEDHAEAIVLGCAGMTDLCGELTRELGVPVIDGVGVAVKFAEALVGAGLTTSKRGDFALPPRKALCRRDRRVCVRRLSNRPPRSDR